MQKKSAHQETPVQEFKHNPLQQMLSEQPSLKARNPTVRAFLSTNF